MQSNCKRRSASIYYKKYFIYEFIFVVKILLPIITLLGKICMP